MGAPQAPTKPQITTARPPLGLTTVPVDERETAVGRGGCPVVDPDATARSVPRDPTDGAGLGPQPKAWPASTVDSGGEVTTTAAARLDPVRGATGAQLSDDAGWPGRGGLAGPSTLQYTVVQKI